MIPLLVLRPEPGATATAARARALGLHPIVAPLFAVARIAWTPLDPAGFDALMLTSANGVRMAGDALSHYAHLPAFAVGEATAEAARAAGLSVACTGEVDAHALLAAMAAAGVQRALHLAGVDRREAAHPDIAVTAVPVYRAEAIEALPPPLVDSLRGSAVALLHSPRAAGHFARLIDRAGLDRARIAIAAISAAARDPAGEGWRAVAVAASPNDAALLAEAARMCEGGA